MDLVHCMRCGYWPKLTPDHRLQFYLSRCGRLLCENCVVATGGKCLCGSSQCSVQAMSQVGKDITYLFGDPGVTLQEGIKKVCNMLLFQNSLMKSCLRMTGKLMEINQKLKAQTESQQTELEALRLERQNLVNYNQSLKSQQQRVMSQISGVRAPVTTPRGSASDDHLLHLFRSDSRTSPKPVTQVTPFQFPIPPNSAFAASSRNYSPAPSTRTTSHHSSIFRATPSSSDCLPSVDIFRTPQTSVKRTRSFHQITPSPRESPVLSQTSEIAHRLRNIRCTVVNNPGS